MTANRKRLPAGKVMKLFLAGAGFADLVTMFRTDYRAVEAALRRQIARVCK